MENATDALIMAGSILLLIVALTVAISSLSNLRTQTQGILNEKDQLMAMSDESGYINYLRNNGEDKRTVGIETIITSIRRTTKEDFTIYIKANESIDLDTKYNDIKVNGNGNFIRLSLSGVDNKYVDDYELTNRIFEKLKNKRFKEYIGIYQNKTSEGVSDANKTTYKIITYEEAI